ncbi:NDUFAB1, acyl carrier protein/NADH-ubiquinone oxidoreductase [Serpula lacrymans var. lacrymans S7.3]|uniref:Acyl carrier protein n=2 Tax=Serpula lacrymans var. lacrymans TaxID=341189 RepID=F8PLV9_SERL3|nr:NdufAB1, acyl carrier protein/NADH-ubiquinone oxidoreductase [Serpula lacrymans var. lacrymans S7.9]EGO02591.1 NDUFAB1, acyl carrier protein/NADH-ubiquinone oxidoreductase [Serpula lacrymans var. lacrymans S7.3]EGO28307.1 NdufAB1, acyl carrier protein/NADH-ubiquinone oxidoreductase [Serpula lacrymans var. lacrymans S7.9]
MFLRRLCNIANGTRRPSSVPHRLPHIRFSAAASLTRDNVQARVLNVVRGFEKVDSVKLSVDSSFAENLGLDSLDTVELVMAMEEEFAIEIPDAEADGIKTVQQAIEYIAKTPEAH